MNFSSIFSLTSTLIRSSSLKKGSYSLSRLIFVRGESHRLLFGNLRYFSSSRIYKMSSGDIKPVVVFVLGAPGAGKGTQCLKIVEKFGYHHLSAGDLLRAERADPKSEFGNLIETHIVNGEIVPNEITCTLLERAMAAKPPGSKFLIDGYPRNADNMNGWNKVMGEKVDFKFVLFFECLKETCIERCISRGSAGSGRSDDNIASLTKRFETFQSSTVPVVEEYEKSNAVRKIDSNRDVDSVFEDVCKIFQD